jgi:hypothetical protein
MLRRVALVRTDVSEERSKQILRSVRRLPVTANISSLPILVTLMMEALRSSETSVLVRATRRNIIEDGMLLLLKVCLYHELSLPFCFIAFIMYSLTLNKHQSLQQSAVQ